MAEVDPYRRIAAIYDRLVEPLEAGVRRVALDVVPPQSEWRVLDVGCGTGTGLALYLAAGCTVTGVDVSPAMLAQAQARLGDGVELHLTKGEVLPFEAGRFDLVTASMVVHEIADEDRPTFLAELARCTRPGGRILITDFRIGSLRGWRGPILRIVNTVIERFSGHYAGYRSFRATGGIPALAEPAGVTIGREKIVAGGNIGIYVLDP
jgi:ubiquinone/menaquinone biosynthesis C-methylase UbiE